MNGRAAKAVTNVILQLQGIEKSFYGVPVLKGVSFSLPKGKILGLVGENGAGKSTLMNIIGGVIQADSGHMSLAGEAFKPQSPLDALSSKIAFIHQELNLFTNLSIAENLFIASFPRRGRLSPFIDKKQTLKKTTSILKQLTSRFRRKRMVEQLSPGERQLVEIAKALCSDARIIIFDEPTSSLTSKETTRLFAIINRLRAQKGFR
ncbi:MAG: ATP-binding cassette domain-containing protein [Pyrinomonadaceae bacterium]